MHSCRKPALSAVEGGLFAISNPAAFISSLLAAITDLSTLAQRRRVNSSSVRLKRCASASISLSAVM